MVVWEAQEVPEPSHAAHGSETRGWGLLCDGAEVFVGDKPWPEYAFDAAEGSAVKPIDSGTEGLR